uniref:Coenzyme Q4 homolog (S. cerevisiae) n=1 Tax=Cyclopterus lumpus TaxID=8103 RepID=A0A8C2ZEM2_CYCLU
SAKLNVVNDRQLKGNAACVHSSSSVLTDSCYDGLYPGHIHTTPFQKALLAVGSGVAALQNPYRHDMVAVLGGDNRTPSVNKYQDKMRNDPEGYTILTESHLIMYDLLLQRKMASLPDGSLGREYLRFLEENVSVRFVDDEELAYVMQRYREVHDIPAYLTGNAHQHAG